ncbi:MAG: Rieske 2Fe-2S domain-containing protein [Pseudomonadales bacterium]|nr:Rieske 2Fe-2S domain-containing protein [Pseudomonadales bacterium]
MNIHQSQFATNENCNIKVIANDTSLDYPKIRPQRLHTWFNLIPVDEYEKNRPKKILFLDSFATVVKQSNSEEVPYKAFFEGDKEMSVVVRHGIIFVWYGDDLTNPDRPFPTLFENPYPTKYVTSVPTIFENTHVMDFVENGSDNLHFRHVHKWEHSKIYNHKITPDTITLEQDTRIHYGRCSFNPFIRAMSYILPTLILKHDYAYHGPGIAIVGAEGKGSPESHSMVTLTPEGENRTRVYVTIAMPETTFPPLMEKTYQFVTGGTRKLCEWSAGVLANYVKNEFDVDAVIWKDRKVMHQYNLLRSEKHLQNVIDWGKTFYPKDFIAPSQPEEKTDDEREWLVLDSERNIRQGKIKSYKIGTQSVIAYRDSKNIIHVKDAYCPHQGAHLGVEGRIENDCVRCPFHGFHFNSDDGNCRGSNVDNERKVLEGLHLKAFDYRVVKGKVEVFI